MFNLITLVVLLVAVSLSIANADTECAPSQNCPVARCTAPPEGCQYVFDEFKLQDDGKCCPILCNLKCEDDTADRNLMLVGGDRDKHGCIGSAGYRFCAPLNQCVRPWLVRFNCQFDKEEKEIDRKLFDVPTSHLTTVDGSLLRPLVGSGHVRHGCIGSAGYQWSRKQKRCIRPWFEMLFKNDKNEKNIVEERKLQTSQDLYDSGCSDYNDGCNACKITDPPGFGICTLVICAEQGEPHCTQCREGFELIHGQCIRITRRLKRINFCKRGCAVYNDGCNICRCLPGKSFGACTRKFCFRKGEPYCIQWRGEEPM